MNTTKYGKPMLALAMMATLGAGFGVAAFASANTTSTDTQAKPTRAEMKAKFGEMKGMKGKMGHGVMGTVSSISGNTITVTTPDGKTYTVEAGSAEVKKMVTTTISDIAVGERIGVHGDVSGTTVTAKQIMADMPEMPVKTQAQ